MEVNGAYVHVLKMINVLVRDKKRRVYSYQSQYRTYRNPNIPSVWHDLNIVLRGSSENKHQRKAHVQAMPNM